MTIDKWPVSERPREKLLSLGPHYLTDAELIAILFRTGIKGKTALDLSRELLAELGNLKKLSQSDWKSFPHKAGIGKSKLAMLKAAIELGRRSIVEEIVIGEKLTDSDTTKRFLASKLKDYQHEVFACLFLDSQNQILGFEELFHGTLTEASIYPREIVKRCLAHNAAKIIFAHNHPSGNAEPSQSDQEMTKQLKESLALMEIHIIDHIVIGRKENASFVELGLL